MNILSKIGIVLLLVLIIPAAVIFTHVAVTVPNYRQKWQQEREEKEAVINQNDSLAKQKAALQAQLVDEAERANRAESQLAAERAERVDVLEPIAEDLAQVRVEALQNARMAMQELTGARQAFGGQVDKLLAMVTRLEGERDEARDKNIELADKLRQARADLARAEQEARRAQDRVTQREERISQLQILIEELQVELLEGGGGGAAGVMPAGGTSPIMGPAGGPEEDVRMVDDMPAGGRLEGTVQSVEDDIVGINIGSTHGVEEGMLMLITRGSKVVGYLSVENVLTTEAAGIVTRPQRTPRSGDTVIHPIPAID